MIILCWTLFVVSCAVVLVLVIAALGIISNDAKDDSSAVYLLPASCLFTGFVLLTGKEIFPVPTIILIWKIIIAIICFISLILLFAHRKKSVNYFIGLILNLGLGSIPFLTKLSIQPSNATLPFLEYFNIQFPMVILSFWLPLLVICLLTAFVFSYKKQKYFISTQQSNNNIGNNYENPNFEHTLYKLSLENLSEKISSNNASLNYQFNKMLKSIEDIRNIYMDQIMMLQKNSNNGRSENIPSTFIDKIEKDIRDIKSTILQASNNSQGEINNQTIIRELYHFLATPLASIETNCILINSKIAPTVKNKEVSDYLNIINTSVNICKGVLNTYREIELLPSNISNYKLSELISSSFEVYRQKENKNVSIDIQLTDSYNDLNHYYLMSTLLPLLENAVVASKEKTTIQIEETGNTILISNSYSGNIEIENLKKNGFSTKEGHVGTGLFIVRHLLSARKLGELQCYKKDSRIIFEIPIKKH